MEKEFMNYMKTILNNIWEVEPRAMIPIFASEKTSKVITRNSYPKTRKEMEIFCGGSFFQPNKPVWTRIKIAHDKKDEIRSQAKSPFLVLTVGSVVDPASEGVFEMLSRWNDGDEPEFERVRPLRGRRDPASTRTSRAVRAGRRTHRRGHRRPPPPATRAFERSLQWLWSSRAISKLPICR